MSYGYGSIWGGTKEDNRSRLIIFAVCVIIGSFFAVGFVFACHQDMDKMEVNQANHDLHLSQNMPIGSVVAYPAYITGLPKYQTPSLAVIGVEVPDHPDIKTAFIDCSLSTAMGGNCENDAKVWKSSRMVATVTASEFQFQAGRATTVWFVWLRKPTQNEKTEN